MPDVKGLKFAAVCVSVAPGNKKVPAKVARNAEISRTGGPVKGVLQKL